MKFRKCLYDKLRSESEYPKSEAACWH